MKRPHSWRHSPRRVLPQLARLADPLMRHIEGRRLEGVGPIPGLRSVHIVTNPRDVSKEDLLDGTVRALRDGIYVGRPSPYVPDVVVLHPERAGARRREELPDIRFGLPLHPGMHDEGFDPCAVALSILSTPPSDPIEETDIVSALEDMASIHSSETMDPQNDHAWAMVQYAPTPWAQAAAGPWTGGFTAALGADGVVVSHPAEVGPPTIGQDIVRLPPCVRIRVSVRAGNRSCLHVEIGPMQGHVRIPSPGSTMRADRLDAMETLRVVERLRRKFPS